MPAVPLKLQKVRTALILMGMIMCGKVNVPRSIVIRFIVIFGQLSDSSEFQKGRPGGEEIIIRGVFFGGLGGVSSESDVSSVVYIFYIRIFERKGQNMQLKYQQNSHYSSAKMLQKCTSMPSFSDTTSSSNHSIDSSEEELRKSAVRWILSYHKKVSRDTQYLAVSYLQRLTHHSLFLTEENYEHVALAVLLIAAKMNEIYPPKITSMITKCRRPISKEDIIALEGSILQAMEFEVALESTPYTYLHSILGHLYAEKLEECQKLYRMVANYKELYQFGDEIAAYALIYLIIPDFVRKMKLRQNQKIKSLAIKVYNIYTQAKEQYEREKQNRCR